LEVSRSKWSTGRKKVETKRFALAHKKCNESKAPNPVRLFLNASAKKRAQRGMKLMERFVGTVDKYRTAGKQKTRGDQMEVLSGSGWFFVKDSG